MDLALFDFDGTRTDREMSAAFLAQAATPRRLAIGRVVLAPLVAGYRVGCFVRLSREPSRSASA